MKKRINRLFVLISVVAIVLSIGLVVMVYHNLFRSQIMTDLREYGALIKELQWDGIPEGTGETMVPERLAQIGQRLDEMEIRLTWVDSRGEVLYDNEVDSKQLENHLDRPEIKDALNTGEGQAVRNSETLARNTFYYALRLEDGSVLRVARNADSLVSMFTSVLPTIMWILAALILLSLGMAHFLTEKLLCPIVKMAENMDSDINTTDYEELTPFINTIQKQHQDILKNAKIRQEFTANVSHELKTPLTSISGYAELIETGMASEADIVRFAHGIRSSADRLLTLINDIIRLSELDGSEKEPVFEVLNLSEVASDCVETLQRNAEKSGVTLTVRGEGCKINGDRQMVEELIYNLCDNAIRYNNAGGSVTVSTDICKAEGEGRGTEAVVLSVKDTGIGIPKEHQDRIFERFYRVDKSRSKSTGGTGLGLAIVKHIVEKLGAKIELDSEPGQGTEVRVVFPGARGI
ncbi:MAG: ATP-binding protein [Acetatifactor sp.]